MKPKPISFSAPMVLALLAGRKTQTRRICGALKYKGGNLSYWPCPYGQPGDVLRVREAFCITGRVGMSRDGIDMVQGRWLADGAGFNGFELSEAESAKFALWKKPFSGKPPMYMFASLSRLFLRVESVRCERLQDISEADALEEGIVQFTAGGPRSTGMPYVQFETRYGVDTWLPTSEPTAVRAYRRLWESINGPGSWALNPLVWAVTFSVDPAPGGKEYR